MASKKDNVDTYLDTIRRIEPDVAMIDASAFYASAAISLKRIADAFERRNTLDEDKSLAAISDEALMRNVRARGLFRVEAIAPVVGLPDYD